MELINYREDLTSILDDPIIREVREADGFYFQKALDKYEEYIELELDDSIITSLIEKTKLKPFSYKKLLEEYDEGSIEHKIILIIGELVSYIDMNAAMKNELNEYEDKRTMGLTYVRQNIWIQHLLTYKLDGSLDNLPEIIRGAVKYIEDPFKEVMIFKKDDKEKISHKFFDGDEENIIKLMREAGMSSKNPINDGCLYSMIFYNDDIRKIWDLRPGDEIKDHRLYGKEDFLSDVFISEEKYETILSILERKKNIILQGPPGVGKTYAAKRLAYSIIGKEDSKRVKMIQFHQSYTYEDFIMGYRPSENGFELREGPFYKFSKKAAKDLEQKYFFIIDEINRGNMSKIFGELMMLIEGDKRGEKMTLTYSDEEFYIPENLYIIGMMNTADRSLAIIDYALRRRFSFIDLEPAFEKDSFKKHLLSQGATEDLIDRIIDRIVDLNLKIEEDLNLGRGFKIGHSYFCNYQDSDRWYEEVIKYEIKPLIEEYWFDDEEKVKTCVNDLLG